MDIFVFKNLLDKHIKNKELSIAQTNISINIVYFVNSKKICHTVNIAQCHILYKNYIFYFKVILEKIQ